MSYAQASGDDGGYGSTRYDGYGGYYGYGGDYDGYGSYGYGYDPVSSSQTFARNDATGTTYQHTIYADANGQYYRSLYEVRTGTLDTLIQYQSTYGGGQYYTSYSVTYTPLDGVYAAYGTRDTTTYDLNIHTATLNDVYFSASLTTSYFSSHDYATGAFVTSYDVRTIYGGGYYETLQTYYHGPSGSNSNSVSGYHDNA